MSAATRLDIAIMDRNPHVREFLCRELIGLGHVASALPSAVSLLEALCGPRPPRILVLDPEAAGTCLPEVAKRLRDRAGQIAVVLHVFEGADPQPGFDGAMVVEKQPDMGALKAALSSLSTQISRLSEANDAPGLRQTRERA